MDQIAFACASKHSRKYCVTASVDTVDFLSPIEVGELVTMKASINYIGRSSMVVGIRVEAENIQSGFVKHCNSSFFTMIAKDENGKSIAVPGLILENNNDIRRFMKCVKRIQMKRQRKQEFHEIDFTSENYVKHLNEYNVQIVKEINQL
jgi:acyl-CoA hydrolase